MLEQPTNKLRHRDQSFYVFPLTITNQCLSRIVIKEDILPLAIVTVWYSNAEFDVLHEVQGQELSTAKAALETCRLSFKNDTTPHGSHNRWTQSQKASLPTRK